MDNLKLGDRCIIIDPTNDIAPSFKHCVGQEVEILGLPGSAIEPWFQDAYEITNITGHPVISKLYSPRQYLKKIDDDDLTEVRDWVKKNIDFNLPVEA